MKKRILAVIMVMTMMLLVSSVALAGKTEWKNKNYNAAGIRKIAIIAEIPERFADQVDGYYVDRTCTDFLMEWCEKNGIQSDTVVDIEAKYMAINPKYNELKVSNPQKARDLLIEYGQLRYTAVLSVKIEKFRVDRTYHEGYYYDVTEMEETKYQNSDGSWSTVKYPVHKQKYKAPYTSEEAVVVLDLAVRDLNKQIDIFLRKEERRSDSPNPEKVMKKVCEGYVKDLAKMMKK